MKERNPFAAPRADREAEIDHAPGAKRRTPLGALLTMGGTALLGFGGCAPVLDFGSHVDGPGVGLEFLAPPGFFLVVPVLGIVALVLGVRRVGLALGVLMGVVGLFVAIVCLVFVFGALMPMSWERACDRGEGRACWGPMRRARSKEEGARWAAKGCRAGDEYACREWLEIAPNQSADACAAVEKACASRADPVACVPRECRREAEEP
jgi:hypothetical protein